jgi:DNA-binding NtrC family response regulator
LVVFINGSFGIGKTTVARLLAAHARHAKSLTTLQCAFAVRRARSRIVLAV